MTNHSNRYVSVVNCILPTGERLPLLVYTRTYIPVYLATRWAIRYRKYRVQSSTLRNDLRILGRLYSWGHEIQGIDLHQRLTSEEGIERWQLDSLIDYLKGQCRSRDGQRINANAFNNHLNVIHQFLDWSLKVKNLDHSSHDTYVVLYQQSEMLQDYFHMERFPGQALQPRKAVTDEEVQKIYKAIAPVGMRGRAYLFNPGIFCEATALRNFLMFAVAYQAGLRIGEILKLTVDSLPRRGDAIHIKRLADDPYDTRSVEPAVKTKERKIPVHRSLLRALTDYVELPQPQGRLKDHSPYLFLAINGNPLSVDRAQDIIAQIGRYSHVQGLTWHRLRHSFARRKARQWASHPNCADYLQYVLGHSSYDSVKHYTEEELVHQAMELMRQDEENELFNLANLEENSHV